MPKCNLHILRLSIPWEFKNTSYNTEGLREVTVKYLHICRGGGGFNCIRRLIGGYNKLSSDQEVFAHWILLVNRISYCMYVFPYSVQTCIMLWGFTIRIIIFFISITYCGQGYFYWEAKCSVVMIEQKSSFQRVN